MVSQWKLLGSVCVYWDHSATIPPQKPWWDISIAAVESFYIDLSILMFPSYVLCVRVLIRCKNLCFSRLFGLHKWILLVLHGFFPRRGKFKPLVPHSGVHYPNQQTKPTVGNTKINIHKQSQITLLIYIHPFNISSSYPQHGLGSLVLGKSMEQELFGPIKLSGRALYNYGQMINSNVINHVTKERLGWIRFQQTYYVALIGCREW